MPASFADAAVGRLPPAPCWVVVSQLVLLLMVPDVLAAPTDAQVVPKVGVGEVAVTSMNVGVVAAAVAADPLVAVARYSSVGD